MDMSKMNEAERQFVIDSVRQRVDDRKKAYYAAKRARAKQEKAEAKAKDNNSEN